MIAADTITGINKEGVASNMTPLERYMASIKVLEKMVKEGLINEKEYMKAESFLAKKHCIKPDSIYRSNHLLFLRNRVIDSNAEKEANNG